MNELAPAGQLSFPEHGRLDELEAVIQRGLETFVEVGLALGEIRDSRLYRETHGSFEGYCEQRWGFTDRRGRQLIAAAEIGTMVPVTNERQARELAPLLDEPEQLRETWAEVRELHDKPTAADVRKAVKGKLPPPAQGEQIHERDFRRQSPTP